MTYFEDIKAVATIKLPWEKLRGKNILVTGATGMICSAFIEVLMSHDNQDFHVYASGRNEAKAKALFAKYNNNPFFHFIKYDVCNPLENSIPFHIIIAGAGVASPQLYTLDPVGVMKSNFNGVDNLFSYGINHGLEIFLYISSGEVYGEGDGREFTEDYSGYVNSMVLRSCYPSAKRASESLCIAYSHQYNIDVRIARPCHIYGPNFNASDNRVYAQFIRNILSDEDVIMKSSGAQFRSWCYVADCAAALLYILLKGENRQAYNIADDSSNISIKELAQIIAEIGGKNVIFETPSHIEKAGFNIVSKSIFSTEKIRNLGWSINGDLRNKMSATIEECRISLLNSQ